jgi:hypothetical protein
MPNDNSYDSKPINPEDLHALAIMISPKKTPCFSDMGNGYDVKNIEHSWETDALSDPKDNAVAEGGATNPQAHALPQRLYNNTQIQERGYFVTTTQEAIARKNGTQTNLGPRMQQAIIELRRDANYAIFNNAAREAHSGSALGHFGGFPYWFNTANYPQAIVVNTGGKKVKESDIISGLQQVYDVHDFDNLNAYCASTVKLAIDNFTGGAIRNMSSTANKAGQMVDVYETSCGQITFKIDRQCPITDIYATDSDYWKKGFLQALDDRQVVGSQNATAHKNSRIVTWELTTECRHPQAGFRVTSGGTQALA